ncbi:hypothetical protein U722_09790 [Bacillus amyloliquefaciens LFB112]|nr:hypothetical protein U722_09790 [Bacillus amyloliquefaciens LFB112]
MRFGKACVFDFAGKACEKCDFHIDQIKPAVCDAGVVLEKGFDVICAPAREIAVTEISHALKCFFQVNHLAAEFFIFVCALFSGRKQGGCFKDFHAHILSR